MSRLRTHSLRLAYGDRVIIEQIDLAVLDDSITVVIGPNGCGKSTLLRALGRLLSPRAGGVELDGLPIESRRTREVATLLSILPQNPIAPEGVTVADLVARGRHPHQRWYRQWERDDEEIVARVLGWTELTELAERPLDELSGGQRQRAWIAMVLAQGTDLLLLDEPTTHLDLAHAVDVLDLVDGLHRRHQRTVVMVLHDINLAARYADQLVVMKEGRMVAQGPPAEILSAELVEDVFGLPVRLIEDAESPTPVIVPAVRRHAARPVGRR